MSVIFQLDYCIYFKLLSRFFTDTSIVYLNFDYLAGFSCLLSFIGFISKMGRNSIQDF